MEKTITKLSVKKIQKEITKDKSRQSLPLCIEVFDSLPSTNTYLKNKPENKGGLAIEICLAEEQTAGRGRFQRSWISPMGLNLAFSLSYPFFKKHNDLGSLSVVAGLSICDSIEQCCKLIPPLFLKWPNDIVCREKKISGILIELSNRKPGVIVGVGINVNMVENSHQINTPWTSIYKETGEKLDRNRLVTHVINKLLEDFVVFEKSGFKPPLDKLRQKDALYSKKITVLHGEKEYTGFGKGIDLSGQLVLQCTNGLEKRFCSGEASILKGERHDFCRHF